MDDLRAPDSPPEITLYSAVYSTVWAIGLASILSIMSMVRGAIDASCGVHECQIATIEVVDE